jgi:hypothetical protein
MAAEGLKGLTIKEEAVRRSYVKPSGKNYPRY